jgi:cytochrome c-type biogenesis protein
VGAHFAELASSGPLLVAIGVCMVAGLVSFLSPCILPLVPGYLSYVTGLAGADLDAALGADSTGAPVQRHGRGRVLIGTLLFIAGFSAVFVAVGVLFSRIGKALVRNETAVEITVGSLIIVLGLAFLGLIPGMQREFRIKALPTAGVAGAPVLGAVFALSWTPCIGPTLGAVLGLAVVDGSSTRAAGLAVAYCAGLGLPFLAFGLGYRRLLGLVKAIRRNSQWVTRIGGALLIIVGLALVTGVWGDFLNWLRATAPAGTSGV